MTFEETGELFDAIVNYYPSFTGDIQKMQSWHTLLKQMPLDQAMNNLEKYASDPENKYPPHPGALMTKRTDMDLYHEQMRHSGSQTLEKLNELREGIAPPTDEQRRRVRELLG